MSMQNSNDTIGNRIRDLPTCSAVPQPAAPPHVPYPHDTFLKFDHVLSHNPAVRAGVIDLRHFTVGKGLSQWAGTSVLFEYSFKFSIYEAHLKHGHLGGSSLLTCKLEDGPCNKGM
jgi:hypothetical protein